MTKKAQKRTRDSRHSSKVPSVPFPHSWHGAALQEGCNACHFPRPGSPFPEALHIIITGHERPGLVLHSSHNLGINLILLVVCCISAFITPHMSIIHFLEKHEGWRGEGAGRREKRVGTCVHMMNLPCVFSLRTYSPLPQHGAGSSAEDSGGAQGRGIRAIRSKAHQGRQEKDRAPYYVSS